MSCAQSTAKNKETISHSPPKQIDKINLVFKYNHLFPMPIYARTRKEVIHCKFRRSVDPGFARIRFSLQRSQKPIKIRILFLYADWPSGFVQKTMFAACRTYDVVRNAHGIAKRQFCRAQFQNLNGDIYYIGKRRILFIVACDGKNRGEDTLPLHFVIAPAKLIHKADSCFFHKPDIIGMMRTLHFIGFVILYFMLIFFHGLPPFKIKKIR